MTITTRTERVRLCALMLLPMMMVPIRYASAAQDAPLPADAPRVTVSGNGEAVAPAARANLTIGIQTQAATAAAAGSEGARLSQAITGALRSAGLPAADLKASHLIISPQWMYDDHTHQRRRTGFQTDTTLIIDTAMLDKLGSWIDAALANGATNVSDPRFAPADEPALRRLALSRAVHNARGDADVIANAAGGRLGPLLQISQGAGIVSPMANLQEVIVTGARRGAAPGTDVLPEDIHMTATVTGQWRYIAGPDVPSR